MATTIPPRQSTNYYAQSALLAQQAVKAAAGAPDMGRLAAVAIRFQVAAAVLAERATGSILRAQGVRAGPEARLNPAGWTTPPERFAAMAAETDTDAERDRLIASIVQETARAAQGAAVATREGAGWVRHLDLPSCARCAVLAGRVYRWSDGFRRHPGCDCVMTPVAEDDDSLVEDPAELVRSGRVHGLSKDDRAAIEDGADFNQVVNVRRAPAGLTESGRVLAREGRLTPAGIYRLASDRAEALALFQRNGYML